MDRIINVRVNGSYITRDNGVAGVQGEVNSTSLRITFDSSWELYAKKITWLDARGENPVEITLTANLLEDIENRLVYIVPIPGEALTVAGHCSFIIDGYTDGVRQRSTADQLKVLDGMTEDTSAQQFVPTQAEQLQAQFEAMLGKISEDLIAAQDAATQAAASATSAGASESSAAQSVDDANSAKNAAAEMASSAQESASAAEKSKTDASESATESRSWAVGGTGTRQGEDTNNAKYWCESAQTVVGGGVRSFNGRSGAVLPKSGDYTAEMVGADPSGSASGAVSAHNVSPDAHEDIRALVSGKEDAGAADAAVSEHNADEDAHPYIRQLAEKSGAQILDAAPTESTPGNVGQFALHGEDLYVCVSATDGVYVWNKIARTKLKTYTDVILSDTTWVAPASENNEFMVQCFGGGGGGGQGSSGGGGGGGGRRAVGTFNLTPGMNVSITIGLGGDGASSTTMSNANGKNGGATAFGTYLSANGGSYGGGMNGGDGGSGGGGGFQGGASGKNGGAGSYGGGGGGGIGQNSSAGNGGNGGTYGGGGGGGGCQYNSSKYGTGGTGGEYGGDGGNGSTPNGSYAGTPAEDGTDTSNMRDVLFSGPGVAGQSFTYATSSYGGGGGGGGGYGGNGGDGKGYTTTSTDYGGGGGGGGYGGNGGNGSYCGGGGGGYGGNGGHGKQKGGGGGGGYGLTGNGGNGATNSAKATAGGTAAGGGGGHQDYVAAAGGNGCCVITYTVRVIE